MPDVRKIIFGNEEIYHVFNRGIDRRPTFTTKRDYYRALETLEYYRFANHTMRFSYYQSLPFQERSEIKEQLYQGNEARVNILAYCLMPNHFHLLLQQKKEFGISRFMADFTNSYTKYFNAKHERVGPLFQGLFKAVHIESDEQLMHIVRYIHLNPVVSYICSLENLENFPYSSYREYLSSNLHPFVSPISLDFFKSIDQFKEFTSDQIDYGRQLEKIKHLVLE